MLWVSGRKGRTVLRSMQVIEFDTARLRLRQWKATDRAPFAALNADLEVMAHFPFPLPRADSDALAERCEALIAERGWGFWATEAKATGDFIGMVGLHVPSRDLPFSPCVEVGWRLARAFWGRGYATEAARGALAVGFARLTLPQIVSFTAIGNARSRAVMERLGMQRVGQFMHPALPIDSPLRAHCWYRMTATRWCELQRTDELRTRRH